MALMSTAAFAEISWKRTDTTPTPSAPAPATVNDSGEAGSGTTPPATGVKKDAAGTANGAEAASEACGTASLGQIRYNPANGYVEICAP